MKNFLIFLTVLLTTTCAHAQEPDYIKQMLDVAKEAEATDEQLANAISKQMSPDEFLEYMLDNVKIIGPEETDEPVVIRVEGLPEKCTQVWRTPASSNSGDNRFLQLFDESGEPANVFWSKVGGEKYFELIVAENGPDVPKIEIATYTLNYILGPGPGPGPEPTPVPDTPTPDLQADVADLLDYAKNNIEDADRADLQNFYYDFAEVVRNDSDGLIKTTADLRNTHVKAGKLMFQRTGIDGKYAGLPEIIDGILADNLTLEVRPINNIEAAHVLNALSWAFYMAQAKDGGHQ
jgi:hypothetical protein